MTATVEDEQPLAALEPQDGAEVVRLALRQSDAIGIEVAIEKEA
jgi:hypothetical protein